MTLNLAILLLKKDLDNPGSVPIEDLHQAQGLGIEALKREIGNRNNPDYIIVGELPGETKE